MTFRPWSPPSRPRDSRCCRRRSGVRIIRLADEDFGYLRGELFSNDLVVKFVMEPADAAYRSRFDVLAQQVAGKQVIHVGCVDHGPTGIRKKIRHGRWLHQTLSEAAGRCFGVDLDEEGIAYMREQLGYTDVAAADITEQACPPLMAQHWDYLLLPEVLEHVGNPLQFLEALRRRFCDRVGEMIITVPNAFARRNFRLARRGIERINSDHRFWFTPYTLTKVVMDAGLEPRRVTLCRHGPIKSRAFIENTYLRRHPLLRNSIVMTVGFGEKSDGKV